MPSTAKFKIRIGAGVWSAFSDGGFDAANGDVLTIRLEDLPALDVQRILVEVVSLSNGAGVLTFSDGGAPQPPTTDITFTLPATGIIAYLIRCTVYGSFNAAGTQTYDTRERVVVVRSSVRQLRKLTPSESTQYSTLEGWVNAFNEMVESLEISQFDFKDSVRCATIAALPAYTAAGSGPTKTLTMNAVGVLTIDGIATVLSNRVLVKDEAASHLDHGVYYVSVEGTGAVAAVLTRATDANTSAKVTAGMLVPVEEGSPVNADQLFMLTTNNPITLDTTALGFSNFGVLTPLVTAALRGTVSPLGAANTKYQTDGATAGGNWWAYLNFGAAPPVTGTALRFSHGETAHGLDAAGTGTAPVLDWGATTADHVTVGGNDADLDGVDIVGGSAGTVEVRVGATMLANMSAGTNDFGAQLVTTTGDIVVDDNTGFIGVGTSAANGRATVGAVRLPSLAGIDARNIAGTDNVTFARIDNSGGDRLIVGDYVAANRPISILMGATNNVQIYVGGVSSWLATSTYLRIDCASVQFEAGVAAPSIYQQNEAGVGATADTFADHAQDATGGGASVGGDRTIRAGSGATPGTLRLKNASATDRLTVSADYATIVAGERLAGYKTLVFADSPYTVLATDRILYCNVAGGSIVLNAPTSATSAGMVLTLIDTGSAAAGLSSTFDPAGAELVSGAATDVMGGGAGTAYASRTYHCNGSNWFKTASYL